MKQVALIDLCLNVSEDEFLNYILVYWQMNNLTVINLMGYAVETYTLDAQERVESVTNLEGQQLDVTYLVGGLVSSIDRFDGVTVSNVFDTAGNIVETLHDGTSIEQATYRKNGQLLSISNAYATCAYSHDTRGFVTNVAQLTENSLQSSVGYAFDPAGNTTNVELRIDNGELKIAYEYDEAERLCTIDPNPSSSLQLPSPFTLTYNQWNGLLARVSNEHITASHDYNILDAVTNTVYRDGSCNALASFDYKLDVLSLITQKVSVVDGIAITNSYSYDNLGRLTSEQVNTDAAISYSYDLAGNRLTAGGSTFTYTYNKLDGAYHDAAGQITNIVRNGVTLDLSWNTQGQLTSVSTNGAFAESYTWGLLGNRVATTDTRGTTYHAYDGAHCIADYNSSGELIASYTWGSGVDNLLVVTVYGKSSTNAYYALKDHLNSVHALVDESGNIVMTVTYNAWGTPLNSSLSIENSTFKLRYLFQGREYSHATDLYNFRARWYSLDIGRWLSKDPIGLEGGLNLYVFCGNDPVNYRDPFGLISRENRVAYWTGVGATAGAIAGGFVGGAGGGVLGLLTGPGAVVATPSGAVAGAVAGAVEGGAVGGAAGALGGALANALEDYFKGGQSSGDDSCEGGYRKNPQGDNTAKNKEFSDAMRDLGINRKDKLWAKIHHEISGQGLENYNDILRAAREIRGY